MKCVVLLALVAVSSAYPYQTGYNTRYGYSSGIGNFYGNGKNFNINGDGSVTVTTATGRKITISRGTGQNYVIGVTDQSKQGYQGQYYDIYRKYQPAQADNLDQILTQYQGDVSQNTYQQLLGDINSAVQNGQLDDAIYNALLKVNQIQNQVEQNQAIQQLKNQKDQQHRGNHYGQDIVSQTIPFGGIEGILKQQLYNQYQGDISQNTYQQLLDEVNTAVQNGQLDNAVYKALLNANQVQNQAGKYQAIQQLKQALQVQQQLHQQTKNKKFQDQGINQEGQVVVPQTLPFTGDQGVLYQQYGQQVGSIGQLTNQLSQLIDTEKVILNRQSQIHDEQMLQHQQQEQLTQQQLQQQEQQHQQQIQQQYVQQLQQRVQKEQEQVLNQQQQQQNRQYLLNDASHYTQRGGQQNGFLQYQPFGHYQGGLYGVYGQGFLHHNVPLVQKETYNNQY